MGNVRDSISIIVFLRGSETMHKWTRNILGTVAIAVALVAMTLFSGCSGKKGKVSGKVKVGDKPVKFGTVAFLNASDSSKTPGAGTITKEGTYTIETPLEPGKYIITVSCPKPVEGPKGSGFNPASKGDKGMKDKVGKQEKEMEKDKEWQAANYVEIPADYSNPDKKKIVKEVASGDNTIDITIKE